MLGVDPGTAVMGYGVVTASPEPGAQGPGRVRLIECGVVRTKSTESLAVRLGTLFDGVTDLIARHRPDAIAVEGLFHGKNARSALVLGHARGVVLLAADRAGLAVAEISPAEVKRAVTGTGAATKTQVSAMVMKLLHLVAPPKPADAADGVAIALTHLLRAQPRARLTVARR
ncbi:MAG: crossover junction endodeoxyribonuclease RuvC [Gemmatimonadota bacterium]